MTPVVNGQEHHFVTRGVYHGLPLLFDLESESYWNHITGECLHGPLRGTTLPVSPLLALTAYQAYMTYPHLEIAISQQTIPQRLIGSFVTRWGRRIVTPMLNRFAEQEDTRLPRFEIGLGVWTADKQCFYPVRGMLVLGGVAIDSFGAQRVLVYVDPHSRIPACFFTGATAYQWDNEVLRLDTGEFFYNGILYDGDGESLKPERPMQMYSRWYGFSYTFPGCEIYTTAT